MKSTKFVRSIGLVLSLFLFSVSASAQTTIVNYSFNDAVAGATPCNAGTAALAGNVTSTVTTSTGTCTTPAGTATTATAFTQNTTAGTAVSVSGFAPGATQFFQFELGGTSLNTFSNYSVYFQAFRSGTGPSDATLQYSTDGTSFTNFQTVTVPTNTGTPAFGAYNFDLSAVTALNNQASVFFRIVASNGTGSTGAFRIDNFQVQAIGPTAAPANISGRVTAGNRGVSRAMIIISGGDLEEPMYAMTNGFGNYRFENLSVGETYVVQLISKRYRFANSTMVITLQDNVANADFAAEGK